MKITIVIILLFTISGFTFKSENSDIEEIITLFLESYVSSNEVSVKKDTVFVLNKNSSSLQQHFIPRILKQIKRYEKLSKECDLSNEHNKKSPVKANINDPCARKKGYEKFYNVFSENEIEYLKKYERENISMIYSKTTNQKVVFLDSATFISKRLLNFRENNSKIEFRGPFFNKEKDKALLEVYEHPSCLGGLNIVFIKIDENWQMVGNVNF